MVAARKPLGALCAALALGSASAHMTFRPRDGFHAGDYGQTAIQVGPRRAARWRLRSPAGPRAAGADRAGADRAPPAGAARHGGPVDHPGRA